ncbi:hypothetical protein [Actinoplanes sp. HUAS TT8]|uniref:hypothetical protein n=1 Tax=Actinoplanes sp. HUAS TT8 TaxID=3447453 RepID=UPI003F52066F
MAEYVRDLAMSAVIFGFFASSWFGWAQEAPPRRWRPWLIAGSVLSFVTLAAGIVLAVRHWNDGSAFDGDTSRVFGIVVGIEFGAAGLGAILLAVRHRAELIPVWIAFVVGVHLFPVAVIMNYPLVHVTAALVTLASLAAIPLARSRHLTPSAAVGAPTGVILVATGLVSAVAAAI